MMLGVSGVDGAAGVEFPGKGKGPAPATEVPLLRMDERNIEAGEHSLLNRQVEHQDPNEFVCDLMAENEMFKIDHKEANDKILELEKQVKYLSYILSFVTILIILETAFIIGYIL